MDTHFREAGRIGWGRRKSEKRGERRRIRKDSGRIGVIERGIKSSNLWIDQYTKQNISNAIIFSIRNLHVLEK